MLLSTSVNPASDRGPQEADLDAANLGVFLAVRTFVASAFQLLLQETLGF